MESDKLHSMRRNLLTGECEHVPAMFWRDHVIDITLPRHIEVYRRRDIDGTPQRWGTFAHQAADRINGWVFFVWKPDFDRLYFASAPVDQHDARGQPSPSTQEPTPQQRKPRKRGGGRRPMFTAQQQQWLREKYSSDLKADPLLAKHEAAVAHVQNLANNQYGIEAGRDTLLDQIIRPVQLI
jgi:hypothetical protein